YDRTTLQFRNDQDKIRYFLDTKYIEASKAAVVLDLKDEAAAVLAQAE
ncbi:7341_t:CDS:2, partial [Racocetra persica]